MGMWFVVYSWNGISYGGQKNALGLDALQHRQMLKMELFCREQMEGYCIVWYYLHKPLKHAK